MIYMVPTRRFELLNRHEAGEEIESVRNKKPTLNEYLSGTYMDWAVQNRKLGSKIVNRMIFTCEMMLNTRVDRINELQVERWKAARLKSGVTPSTVKRDLAELKAALNRAVKWGYALDNPAKGVTPQSRSASPCEIPHRHRAKEPVESPTGER